MRQPWILTTVSMQFFSFRIKVDSIPNVITPNGDFKNEFFIVDKNENKKIGWLGQLHPQIAKQLDLPTTWVAQLDSQILLDLQVQEKKIAPPAKYPQVRRDIAILVDKNIPVQIILADIRQTGSALLKDCWLFDIYEGDKLPVGKRSLAFGLIFQDPENTLADEVVNQNVQNVLDVIAKQHNAVLR